MEQGGEHSGGFTVIETLIVLAVSALLAASALLLINGRQNKTEFQTAVNDLQQQLQQTLSQTQNGFYPNSGEVQCTGNDPAVGGGPLLAKAAAQQGTNTGCIFLGKVIQLGTVQNPDGLVMYSVVGNQHDTAGNPTQKLATSFLTAIAPTPSHVNYPDVTTTHALQYGLTVSTVAAQGGFRDISSVNPWASPVGQLAVLVGDTQGNIADYNNSSSPNYSLYVVKTTGLGTDQLTAASQITYAHLKAVNGARLCVNSGTTAQSALITIGGTSTQSLGVNLDIHQKADCL